MSEIRSKSSTENSVEPPVGYYIIVKQLSYSYLPQFFTICAKLFQSIFFTPVRLGQTIKNQHFFSLFLRRRRKIYVFVILSVQTSSDGNQTTSTLSITLNRSDAGRYLSCRAYNHAVPSDALEDGWRLDIQCKFISKCHNNM